jgi:disulfide bond formation protein DsbB
MATYYEPEPAGSGLTWAALLAALGGIAGSLYLTLGMGLKPCPLCYYQRSFMMGVGAVLLLGLFTRASRVAPLSLLALPLGAAGAGVAGFHVYLEKSGALECPAGLLGYGSAPQQSLALYVVLLILLVADALKRGGGPVVRFIALLLALGLGGGIAYGCVVSVVPEPPPHRAWPEGPTKTCRIPFRESRPSAP